MGQVADVRRSEAPPKGPRTQVDGFSIREAKEIIHDLFPHRNAIYLADFLATVALAYACAGIYFLAAPFSNLQMAAFVPAGLLLFRGGVFMHEIVHFPKNRLRLFKVVWNLLYGVPMLSPSFMYKNHKDHHRTDRFGTARDGEYLPLGAGGVGPILVYLAQMPFLPLFAIGRFLILTPLSLASPRVRRWTLERASAYVCNPRYRRELPPGEAHGIWLLQELLCFAFLAGAITLIVLGVLPFRVFPELYLLGMYGAALNWLRNLAAHHYRNTGARMNLVQQLGDSVTITGHPLLTELLFPVGLRYHSLHHLFPTLPYHSMGRAHRRLMRRLPKDSLYRQTVYPSFRAVLKTLWHDAREASRMSVADNA